MVAAPVLEDATILASWPGPYAVHLQSAMQCEDKCTARTGQCSTRTAQCNARTGRGCLLCTGKPNSQTGGCLSPQRPCQTGSRTAAAPLCRRPLPPQSSLPCSPACPVYPRRRRGDQAADTTVKGYTVELLQKPQCSHGWATLAQQVEGCLF